MRNVWAVVKREYLQRVRSRWFIFATVGGPLLLIAAFVLPVYLESKGDDAESRLAVLDRTQVLYDGVARRLEEGGLTVIPVAGDSALPEVIQRVADDELSGYLLLDAETLQSGTVRWYGKEAPSALRSLSLRQAVVTAALTTQLEDAGVDAGALLSGGDLAVEILGVGESARGQLALGFMGAFILYMVILLYAVSVMRATLEEKTSRVVEVVISAMKPWHLMLGKILGVGAVGLTQLAVWALASVLLASTGIPMLLAARPELMELADLGELVPGVGLASAFLALFLFGYFIFSGLYAAVGAMCNTDEEAQQAQFPVMLLILIPIILVMPVIEHPASPMATWMSLVPFFTPILMWPRIAAGVVPAWQVGLAFVLMGLTVVAVAWVAGRIYKVGILMAGKRPTLPELWRWIREA